MLWTEPGCSSALWGWDWAALTPGSPAVVQDLGTPSGTLLPDGCRSAPAHFILPVNLCQAPAVVVGQAVDWILVNQLWKQLIGEET